MKFNTSGRLSPNTAVIQIAGQSDPRGAVREGRLRDNPCHRLEVFGLARLQGRQVALAPADEGFPWMPRPEAMDQRERHLIGDAQNRTGHNRRRAAMLPIFERTLWYRPRRSNPAAGDDPGLNPG